MATRTFNFTVPRLDALQPAAARYEVKDQTVKGLVLRVSPGGVKTFSVFSWVPAKRRPERVTLGKYPAVSIDAARTRAKKVMGQIAEGKSPATEKRQFHAEDTFEAVFEKYMANHVLPKLSRKVQIDTQGLFDNYVKPSHLHTRKLSDIRHTDIEALHTRVGKLHPRTANKVVALVRGVFRYAARHGVALLSPTIGISQYQINARERFLQPEEMPRFLAALDATVQPHQDVFRLLLFTGVRLGNMLAAQFDQFDLEHGIWSVPGSQHKNRKPHALPLLPEAVAIVQRRRAEVPKGNPWLWPSDTTNSGHLTHVRNVWDDLLDRAGIADLRRHDVRRTVGAWLSIGGANMQVVGKALGHSTIHATQVYARLTLDPVRNALAGAIGSMQVAGSGRTSNRS